MKQSLLLLRPNSVEGSPLNPGSQPSSCAPLQTPSLLSPVPVPQPVPQTNCALLVCTEDIRSRQTLQVKANKMLSHNRKVTGCLTRQSQWQCHSQNGMGLFDLVFTLISHKNRNTRKYFNGFLGEGPFGLTCNLSLPLSWLSE